MICSCYRRCFSLALLTLLGKLLKYFHFCVQLLLQLVVLGLESQYFGIFAKENPCLVEVLAINDDWLGGTGFVLDLHYFKLI